MSLFIKTDDVTSGRRDVGPHGQLWAAAWAVPADRSKFQLRTMARRITITFTQSGLNPAAEIVLNMLFITLLTPHNTQKRRTRKERTK